jgi:hypothetical protein
MGKVSGLMPHCFAPPETAWQARYPSMKAVKLSEIKGIFYAFYMYENLTRR